MDNFKPGGFKHRKNDFAGRPRSDADYSTKKRFDKKPSFGGNRGGQSGDRGNKDVQLFKATCTTCGQACEVPFRPDGIKPVLCRDCFARKNASPNNDGDRDRGNFTPSQSVSSYTKPNFETGRLTTPAGINHEADFLALKKQLSTLEVKMDKILEQVKALDIKPSVVPKVASIVSTANTNEEVVVKKVRKPKKAVAKKAITKKVTKKSKKK